MKQPGLKTNELSDFQGNLNVLAIKKSAYQMFGILNFSTVAHDRNLDFGTNE